MGQETKNKGPAPEKAPLHEEETGTREGTGRHEELLVRQLREQLHQALAREQEARGEIQQIMHMLSHDLRSPMSTISNFLGIILTRHGHALDEKSKEYIGYALEGIKKMGQLLTDAMYYAKIGSRGISRAEVDSNRVLERALLNLKSEMGKTKAEVSAQGLPKIKGDETLLVQVFQNLLSNSLKFIEGTPKILISAARLDNARRDYGSGENHAEWLFSFKDNGAGIRPEDKAAIFAPFAHPGAVRNGKGTGLGLAICRKIVELHGGRIWVESAPGEGSTFYFTIQE